MAHGQLSFLSVQISPALNLFAEFVVAKAKHLHLRLMQSELAPQEAAKRLPEPCTRVECPSGSEHRLPVWLHIGARETQQGKCLQIASQFFRGKSELRR